MIEYFYFQYTDSFNDPDNKEQSKDTDEDSDENNKLQTEYRKMQLDKHNTYRATHQSSPMSLDDRLNNDADEYAKKLAAARHWLSQKDHDKSTKDGENLGLKCSKDSYPPFDDVTDKW